MQGTLQQYFVHLEILYYNPKVSVTPLPILEVYQEDIEDVLKILKEFHHV